MAEGKKSGSSLGTLIMMLLMLAIVFINSPGMVIFGLLKYWNVFKLDVGQMWTFSIVSSLAIFFVVFAMVREFASSLVTYLIGCSVVVACCLALYFGFKVDEVHTLLKYYLENKPV